MANGRLRSMAATLSFSEEVLRGPSVKWRLLDNHFFGNGVAVRAAVYLHIIQVPVIIREYNHLQRLLVSHSKIRSEDGRVPFAPWLRSRRQQWFGKGWIDAQTEAVAPAVAELAKLRMSKLITKQSGRGIAAFVDDESPPKGSAGRAIFHWLRLRRCRESINVGFPPRADIQSPLASVTEDNHLYQLALTVTPELRKHSISQYIPGSEACRHVVPALQGAVVMIFTSDVFYVDERRTFASARQIACEYLAPHIPVSTHEVCDLGGSRKRRLRRFYCGLARARR